MRFELDMGLHCSHLPPLHHLALTQLRLQAHWQWDAKVKSPSVLARAFPCSCGCTACTCGPSCACKGAARPPQPALLRTSSDASEQTAAVSSAADALRSQQADASPRGAYRAAAQVPGAPRHACCSSKRTASRGAAAAADASLEAAEAGQAFRASRNSLPAGLGCGTMHAGWAGRLVSAVSVVCSCALLAVAVLGLAH